MPRVNELLLDLLRVRQDGLAPVLAADRHDHDLIRRNARAAARARCRRRAIMMTPPTRRVVTPHDVPQTCCTRLVARLKRDVERLGEVLAEVVRRAGLQRAAVAHQRFDRVGAQARRRTSRSRSSGPSTTGIASTVSQTSA